jgi:hypothetical protein
VAKVAPRYETRHMEIAIPIFNTSTQASALTKAHGRMDAWRSLLPRENPANLLLNPVKTGVKAKRAGTPAPRLRQNGRLTEPDEPATLGTG